MANPFDELWASSAAEALSSITPSNEAWFHGDISRKEAWFRLESVDIPGKFLMRGHPDSGLYFTAYEGEGKSTDFPIEFNSDGCVSINGEQAYVLGTNPEMNDVIGYCNNMRNQDGMPVDGGLESYLCWGMTKAEVQAAVLAGQPGDYMLRYQVKTNLYIVTICDHHNVVGNVGIFIEQSRNGSVDTLILRNESFEALSDVVERLRLEPFRLKTGEKLLLGEPVNWNITTSKRFKDRPAPCSEEVTVVKMKRDPARAKSFQMQRAGTATMLKIQKGFYMVPLDVDRFNNLSPKETKLGELPALVTGLDLNRYQDVLPNPVTRVELEKSMNDPTSDYINANFVQQRDGLDSSSYIAAQGPTKNTVATFIRMLWEKHVLVVAMVTGLVEGGKIKCERYWPETPTSEPLTFGNITVQCVSVSEKVGYTVTELLLVKTASGRPGSIAGSSEQEERVCRHYWFTGWPDHGVPSNDAGQIYSLDFLDMVREIRREQSRMTGCPLLIHCSAGIGRTGTYIAIDQGISVIQHQKGTTIDVNEIIDTIREDRMALVQNTAQYKFAYQALLDYGVNGDLHVYAWEESLGDSARRLVAEETMKRNGRWTVTYEGGQMLKRYNESAPKVATNPDEMMSIAFTATALRGPAPTVAARASEGGGGGGGGGSRLNMASNSGGGGSGHQQRGTSTHSRDDYAKVPLEKTPWFVKCDRKQAVSKVAGLGIGHFCVRPSRQAGCYALTVQEAEGSKGVVVVLVITRPDGGFALDNSDTASFGTMPELIKFFTTNPYGEHPITNAALYLAKECL